MRKVILLGILAITVCSYGRDGSDPLGNTYWPGDFEQGLYGRSDAWTFDLEILKNFPDPDSGSRTKLVIFDTDMGSDCDDAGALALLHVYADLGMAKILGCIYSSGKVPYGVGIIDAINTWYGRPDIPLGANYDDEVGDAIDKMLAEELVQEMDRFGHDMIKTSDAEEQTKLNRKLLSKAKDSSVTYITVGHTKALYDLLVSEADEISPLSGLELIEQKLDRWVAMGASGANNEEGEYRQDWNFFRNGAAPYTDYLLEHMPVPMYFIGTGSNVMTGASLASTPEDNMVRAAYETWLRNVFDTELSEQRPSWDLITVMYAIEGELNFLEEEGPGYLFFDPEKGCRWEDLQPGSSSLYHYIDLDNEAEGKLAAYLNHLIARKSGS